MHILSRIVKYSFSARETVAFLIFQPLQPYLDEKILWVFMVLKH